jgi:hypothetical protein
MDSNTTWIMEQKLKYSISNSSKQVTDHLKIKQDIHIKA